MKVSVLHPSDGSTQYEWVLDADHRFGICVDPIPSNSSWFFVSKCKDEVREYGELPTALISLLTSNYGTAQDERISYEVEGVCPECGKGPLRHGRGEKANSFCTSCGFFPVE